MENRRDATLQRLLGLGLLLLVVTAVPATERAPAVPTVSIGEPSSQGDLDKAIIRRYIKRDLSKIQDCYVRELKAKPSLSGKVQAQFFINPDGKVTNSTAQGVDANVASCVAGVIKAIEFPKPKGGGSVTVNYPFTFHQTGGG